MSGSILEKFLIYFESNSKDIKKGAQEAGKATDDLEKKIKNTGQGSKELGQEFLRTVKAAVSAVTALLTVEAALHGVESSIEFAHKMSETSEAIGVNAEQLTAWTAAVEVTGGNADDFIGTVKNLTASMTQLDVVGHSRVAPFFEQLGINMLDASGKARPALEIFPELADAFEKMGKQQSFGFGQKMGLSEATIMFLQRGRMGVEDLVKSQKELGELVKKYGPETQKLAEAWQLAGLSWRAALLSLGGDSLQALQSVAKWLEKVGDWVRAHGTFVKAFLWGVAGALTAVAVASGILLSPWLLLLGAILLVSAALALVLDDIENFVQGNDSLIGRFVQKWKAGIQGWILLFEFMKAKILKWADDIGDTLWDVINWIINKWELLRLKIVTAIQDLITWMHRVKQALGLESGVINVEGRLVGGLPDQTTQAVLAGQNSLGIAGSTPLSAQSSNSLWLGSGAANQNKNSTVNIGEINVQTQATDADGIANDIGGSLTTQMRQANANYDDGVSH